MTDVIVVGAGPAGSAAACHLARSGLDVLILEKTTFPREKVCGDGLTPRAVHELLALGVDVDDPGWFRTSGLRLAGAGRRVEIPWPDGPLPAFGLTRTRRDLDELLVRQAVKAGATLLEGAKVTGPLLNRAGQVVGVTTAGREHHARVVVAADGASSRLSVALGLRPLRDRPIGVAARRYYRSTRHDDDLLEVWLDPVPAGYGWIFGMGDGTCNVGVALLRTARADCRRLLGRWLEPMPPGWGLTEENATTPVRGAALPMGFSRQPHYVPGLLLAGDSGGMVNPSSGEGIAYALEAARLAAETIETALKLPTAGQRERAFQRYPAALKTAHGGAFTLGRAFAQAIENPHVMRLATRHGLSRPALARFAIKVLGTLAEPRGRRAPDRLAAALSRFTPAS
ncbi:geranylgeranyl reductase family protein [Actinomadura graeca]|uniref:Geranylgeranyl reductase family protein n=1 Tax=Actinomadura graeca TaxID=2750812 RepID=A0ABX8QPL9_9ACTN|nr:geranylgeranyl reductase family protein [Actinomadura graeca]QXJ20740.1 geranylgeranyl reductase family protein [Actinomadura graeca]